MAEAVIVDAIRTPIGNLNGALAAVRPDDLAALVLAAIVNRNHFDTRLIDEVFFGCANQAGEDNRNIARMAALLCGLPPEVPALTVNRLCASGLAAVNLAARSIRAGDGEIYLAGGVESMSRAPYAFSKNIGGGNLTAFDTALGWRFVNPRMEALYGTEAMGLTAENIAELTGITRLEQDQFALASHQRAVAAQDRGAFVQEILPVSIPQRKGEPLLVEHDERPRRDTTLAALSKLKPAFKTEGSVTAGNSSGLNDGAAALLVMSQEAASRLNLKPMARVVSSAAAGIAPRIMGLGPVEAVRKALSRANLGVEDLLLVEINEAFAVQTLAVMRELGFSHDITNVNGGAVALGHPLGCSGARILTTLLYEMRRRAATAKRPFYGLATLCVGVGQGEATIIEWLD
ncbi:MAG: thiolase family protein [Anaerolineaceae bacterium]